jgi:hypothetical protein
MPYYIVSVKHTKSKDKFFTLWRPNDHGYCHSIKVAGVYFEYKPGYHDCDASIPVEVSKLEPLFVQVDDFKILPNTAKVRKFLGVKITGEYLIKKSE